MNEKRDKKDFFRLLGSLAGAGVCIAAIVFCIDPFYHYHGVWFGLPVILENAVYQTPGAARHLDYDSVIIGTSMTENFYASWFDELGWDTVKLSYSGARTDDLRAILEQIYSREEPPKNIVMDINAYQLTEASWTAYVERPEYLYTNNLLTDVPYLYNHDILLECLERVADGLQGRESNTDTAYTWGDGYYFGEQAALRAAEPTKCMLMESEAVKADLQEMLHRCDENLGNITPYIEEHPETQFYIFYPPYSMLYWEQEILKGELYEILEVFGHSMHCLTAYENVHIYYFQNETEIIANLDNYRDATHHRPEYNRFIFECIRDNVNIVTEDNIGQYIADMYQYASEFDYGALWGEETLE